MSNVQTHAVRLDFQEQSHRAFDTAENGDCWEGPGAAGAGRGLRREKVAQVLSWVLDRSRNGQSPHSAYRQWVGEGVAGGRWIGIAEVSSEEGAGKEAGDLGGSTAVSEEVEEDGAVTKGKLQGELEGGAWLSH